MFWLRLHGLAAYSSIVTQGREPHELSRCIKCLDLVEKNYLEHNSLKYLTDGLVNNECGARLARGGENDKKMTLDLTTKTPRVKITL